MDRIENFEVNSPRWLSLEDFEGEVWKDIPGYEGWYQASNMGRIKSLDRIITIKRPQDSVYRHVFTRGTIIKGSLYGLYFTCHLKKNSKSKIVKYHRIVCSLFHPNPHNLPEVNHINEIKTDNRAENLEWCDRIHNARHGTALIRASINNRNNPLTSRPVYQLDLNGNLLKKYPSINEAARVTGLKTANICSVCKGGKSKSTGGYLWSFSSDIEVTSKIVRRKKTKYRTPGKIVCQYNMEGILINTYISASEASRQTGICKTNIINNCNNKYSIKHAGGFIWKWKYK